MSVEEKEDKVLWIALGFFAGLIVAVLALEYYGYLRHSSVADSAVVAEFRLVDLTVDEDLKISPKDSGKVAFCANGYLLLRPDNEKQVAAILVDDKMRGVRCQIPNE